MNWLEFTRNREDACRTFVVEHVVPRCSADVRLEIQARLEEKRADSMDSIAKFAISSLPTTSRLEVLGELEEEWAAANASKDGAKFEALDALDPLFRWGFPLFEGVGDAF